MRAAYLILSHRSPDQVERLMSAIRHSSPEAGVVVMHDSRRTSPPHPIDDLSAVVEHGLASDWGSWGIVEATVTGFRIADDLYQPQLLTLISGDAYPARPLQAWESEFLASGSAWQGVIHELRYQPRWGRRFGGGDDDFTRYHYFWLALPGGRFLGTSRNRLATLLRTQLYRVGHYAEPVLDVRNVARGRGMHVGIRHLEPLVRVGSVVKGAQWMALRRDAVQHVLTFTAAHPVHKFIHRHTIIPDESYIQSLLASSGYQIRPQPVTFVKWDPLADEPKLLVNQSDLSEAIASGAPFCRKLLAGPSDWLMHELDVLSRLDD